MSIGNVGRNDPCPCGSKKPNGEPKKYKKCCLPKLEEMDTYSGKIANEDYEQWMKEDEKLGMKHMQEAIHNPPSFDQTPNFAKGSDGEKLFNEMMDEECPECHKKDCTCEYFLKKV